MTHHISITIREATIADIPQIQKIRNSVNENKLTDTGRITFYNYVEFITTRGKGWVSEYNDVTIGFAVADLKENNIWALFVLPDYESMGVGRKLHDIMLNWYFAQDRLMVWLSTSPNIRAEQFYRKAGWIEAGKHNKDEIRFEMSKMLWRQLND